MYNPFFYFLAIFGSKYTVSVIAPPFFNYANYGYKYEIQILISAVLSRDNNYKMLQCSILYLTVIITLIQ